MTAPTQKMVWAPIQAYFENHSSAWPAVSWPMSGVRSGAEVQTELQRDELRSDADDEQGGLGDPRPEVPSQSPLGCRDDVAAQNRVQHRGYAHRRRCHHHQGDGAGEGAIPVAKRS